MTLLFIWCLLCPLQVAFALSATQTTTMISLSGLLNLTAWDVKTDPCSWKGVSCSSDNSSITRLSLSNFGLSNNDSLPVICEIDSLQSLDVSMNQFGSIPDEFLSDCGVTDGLKLLNFSRNRLVGHLPAFSGFSRLESLDFSYNILDGNIGLQLNDLFSLKILNLSYNSFTGSIPLGKSLALEQIDLSVNRFSGNIPEEIANYGNLTMIDFSVNKLVGSIPDTIVQLAKLEVLILSANYLTGNIPLNLSEIPTLTRFAAHQNQISGEIPKGITRHLGTLDLSFNNLNGFIPADHLSPTNLQSVDLSNNHLEGSIPEDMSTSLFRLRLGNNSLNGTLTYQAFAKLGKLMYLELENNNLTGSIPSELGSCHSLLLLSLAQNDFTGVVPSSLSNLSKLEVLKLQFNKLVGAFPQEFTNLESLSVLNISWNSFTGSIPSSIGNLTSLVNLNLQGNNFTGSIPQTIFRMTNLMELQLGQNHLSGVIPKMPPNLQIALNLSSNLFEGPISTNLSELISLEVLDLSNNKFSGEIPEFLTRLRFLTQLTLSNNELSGIKPHFQGYVLVNTSGNPNLTPGAPPGSPPVSTKTRKSVAVAVNIAVSTVLAVLVGSTIALLLSRRFSRINDEQSDSAEDLPPPPPQVIEGKLLTSNGIHKSNIDFNKAMEAVVDPGNEVLKTRFSTYYNTIMPSGARYFVKKLNWSNKVFQLGTHEKFEQEIEALGKLNNSNVMNPLAYVLTADSAYLFYEYAEKGTLYQVLHGSLQNTLDWSSRYSIAVGVAQGLAFLHGHVSGTILLLDLSSSNILLKSLKKPLVGDIELCKVIDPSKSTSSLSTVAGTVGYIPPEYAYTMRVTMAGNVYSFGVVLLELLTGKPAVGNRIELAKWALNCSVTLSRMDQILDNSVRRTSIAVKNQMLSVLKIALDCVSVSPEARPKMKSVLRMLLNAR